MNIPDGAIESIDERDYLYDDIFGAESIITILDKKVLLDNVEYQNQGLEDITKFMCVFYSTGHGSNEENFQEPSDVRINNKEFGLRAKELGRLTASGARVSDGPRTARDEGYISGWALVKTVNEIKYSLTNKRPVVVGSNSINWSSASKSPYLLSGPTGSAHAVVIIGYDDDYEGGCFIIKNSYGDERYDGGKMYLKYSDLGLLYPSRYSLIDEVDPIILYKKKIMDGINIPMAKVGYSLGLYNGLDNTKPITREEQVTVVVRALEKLLNGEITKDQINKLIAEYEA